MVLANPGAKEKRKQTPAQRRASLANLRKARAKTNPKKPAKKSSTTTTTTSTTTKETKSNPKGKNAMATAAQKEAARKNIKKAQAANRKKRGGKRAPRRNPATPPKKRTAALARAGTSTPRKRGRRRNPEVKTATAILEVVGGAAAGGLAAGGADYMMSNFNATATPGRRAMVHAGAAVVVGVGGAALAPGAMGFVGGVAGSFAGLALSNGLRAWLSGSAPPAATPATAQPATPATGTGGNAPMHAIVGATPANGVRAHGAHAGLRELMPSERGRMGAVISNPNQLRAVVQRGPRPTAR
jgi:hypothetical protein